MLIGKNDNYKLSLLFLVQTEFKTAKKMNPEMSQTDKFVHRL